MFELKYLFIFRANYYFEKILLEIEDSFKTRTKVRAVNLYWKTRR
ncbi:hypothetical protein AA20_01245 [Aliarcobacter butzleri L348]|uniref:Uncharacterized protein n=1 Tax=Aliarcobacter butzleri L348 TaxID=1447256 RepID=A0A0G9KD93_9BACT|nr:hypothetical protein AA20_01245 [Aliarcobacter butzleri L348]